MSSGEFTRRQFLEYGSAVVAGLTVSPLSAFGQEMPVHCAPPRPGAVPIPFSPDSSAPVRIRKSVFELNDAEVFRLQTAYRALRGLHQEDPDDPRGWLYQGLVHCWYCSGALDQIYGPEIHGGWFFLPWHRAYLYFHERILGELIGDPTFALPYWDWDTADRNRFPPAYMTAQNTRNPHNPFNPLADQTRAVGPDDRIPDLFVGSTVINNVMGQATFAGFAGAGQGSSGQFGAIESAPHGGVHLWVTNPISFVPPGVNMGVLGTAALDPIFYAHHANIDRLWDVWRASNPTHLNPSEDAWLQQQFQFYDRKGVWTTIAVSDVEDTENSLRFRYQPPAPAPPIEPIPPAGRRAPALVSRREVLQFSTPESKRRLRDAPVTLEAPVASSRSFLAAQPEGKVVLRIDGIKVPPDAGTVVNVFLNLPDANAATSVTVEQFVGTVVVVPKTVAGGSAHRQHSTINAAFDVTKQLASMPVDAGAISVTLVPAAGSGDVRADAKLTYSRAYLTTE